MRRIIENIRSKPHHQRNRIVWICAGVAVGLLLITWMIVGNGRKNTTDTNFFDTFNSGLEEGRSSFENPLE